MNTNRLRVLSWIHSRSFMRGTSVVLGGTGLVTVSKTASSSTDHLSHHASDGGFVNPWPSFSARGFTDLFKWLSSRQKENMEDTSTLKCVPLDLEAIDRFYHHQGPPGTFMMMSWLGHAAMLITLPGFQILFDPCLSDRCSPLTFAGPKRIHPIPCELKDLPALDAIVISHNHYDHMDLPALEQIVTEQTWIFVPLGCKSILNSQVFKNVIECDWWDEHVVQKEWNGKKIEVTVACTPAQHFSSRGLFDRNKTLWSSWVLKSNTRSFYFAGDTGYRTVDRETTAEQEINLPVCPEFQKIGSKYGPFDLAAIPIGAYSPRWFMSPVHCNPWDAVCVHKDVRSKHSIGMHWGTFDLSDEPIHEPPVKLKEALARENIPKSEFHVLDIGEAVYV